MALFESELSSLFDGELAVLYHAGTTLVRAPGKRLRPIILLLACATFGEVTPRAIANACLVELIHTASLVHDDVIDESDVRRNAPSARARWGNKFSILFGDYLLARIFEMAVSNQELALLEQLAPAATEMGRGMMLELTALNMNAKEETYWQVISGKTASLFTAAAGMGAIIGGASAEEIYQLRRMGHALGMAFQLADDLADLQGNEEESGKPLAIDWQQRHATLPLLYTLHHASPQVATQIRTLWESKPFTEIHYRALHDLVEDAGGFEYSWRKVKEYIEEASHSLQNIPEEPGCDALRRICAKSIALPVLPSILARIIHDKEECRAD